MSFNRKPVHTHFLLVLFVGIWAVCTVAIMPAWAQDQVAGSTIRSIARMDQNSRIAHAQLLEKARQGRVDIYFEGDSITRRWGALDYPQLLAHWKESFFGWNAADFAWGGDTVQNILWRLENGELDHVHPKVIVLLAGTNNIGRRPSQGTDDPRITEVTSGIKAIVDLCLEKAPEATILLMGIFPRNDNSDNPTGTMPVINSINAAIAKYGNGKKIRYLNINDQLADSTGKLHNGLTMDKLHLSLQGYRIWADALKPIFTELLGAPAKEDHAPPPTGDPSATMATPSPKIPFLRRQGHATQLMVDNKPYLILGGELGNSSASDLGYLEPHWQPFQKMHLNTILCPVYWELIEPKEGTFDFTLVNGILDSARQHDMRLVLLWFGAWKNSMSCYAPAWVKTNQQRFPRARTQDGRALEILTPFGEESLQADARAFAALMKHIRARDEKDHTVIMVQVENEIGMLQDARDYSKQANALFSQSVPDGLMRYLHQHKASLILEFLHLWEQTGFKASGTWEDVFGKGLHTDELFMAWFFARYTDFVAQAGKAVYPLPMYVNAALIRPGYKPGQYPSAGPLPHLMDVWRAGAPHLDFLSPDIYFKSFVEWCEKYDRSGNALFIPEVGNDQSPANAFYAFAQHDAIGYSPFSIESLSHPDTNPLSQAYAVLRQLTPLILDNQGKDTMKGVLLDNADQQTQVSLGEYTFNVRHEYSWAYAPKSEGETPRVGGMIIMLAPGEFLVAGSGIIVTFTAQPQNGSIAGIERIEEGRLVNGIWTPGRRMNGDQSHQGRHMHLPGNAFGIQKVKLYTYK